MSKQMGMCRGCFMWFESEDLTLVCEGCKHTTGPTIADVYFSMPRRVITSIQRFQVVKGRPKGVSKCDIIFDMNTGKARLKDEEGLEIKD